MASSPASSTGDEQKKNTEQITFRFCSEWYYPLLYMSLSQANTP
jgi:hypothetical protein